MRTLNEEKLKTLSDYIKDYISSHNGTSPRLSEIMEYTGLSKATAYRHIIELEKRGEVSYSGKNTLCVNTEKYARQELVRLPILGKIICGSPDEQVESVDGYISLPKEWVNGECFLLRTYGDSMIDIGIDDGDLVLVKRDNKAENGQVVVALTENGNTLKRYFNQNGKPRLHAENKTYKENMRDFYPQELTIQGIALKLIKNIK